MNNKTLKDIIAYIDFLRGVGYTVTLGGLDSVFDCYLGSLAPYTKKSHALCDELRRLELCREGCADCERPSGSSPEWRQCYAGLCELVYPVRLDGRTVASLHLSGYREVLSGSRERFGKLIASLNESDGLSAAYLSLPSTAPDGEICHAALAPLSYMLTELYKSSYNSSLHTTVEDAYKKSLIYIRDHFTEGISVADVAAELGYSVSYFGYVFKKNMGISANRYITDLQLSRAAELLTSTGSPISYIAEKVGFDDANYFSTAFKARFGTTPRKYREENKKEAEGFLP